MAFLLIIGLVHTKINIWSIITHPNVIPNQLNILFTQIKTIF